MEIVLLQGDFKYLSTGHYFEVAFSFLPYDFAAGTYFWVFLMLIFRVEL